MLKGDHLGDDPPLVSLFVRVCVVSMTLMGRGCGMCCLGRPKSALLSSDNRQTLWLLRMGRRGGGRGGGGALVCRFCSVPAPLSDQCGRRLCHIGGNGPDMKSRSQITFMGSKMISQSGIMNRHSKTRAYETLGLQFIQKAFSNSTYFSWSELLSSFQLCC